MKPSPPRVAIVGGGWAGIACAVELAAAGRAVTLYEAARQLGGRARGVEWNGLCVDNGQHLMIGAYGETLRLLRHLGTAHLLEQRRLELRLPEFRLVLPRLPAPLHLACGLLLTRGLSLSEKWAAARFMQTLQSWQFRLSEDLPVTTLLRQQRQGARLTARLWQPICVAALNTPMESASAQVFCNVLRDSLAGDRGDSDLLLNRADLSTLVAAAALHRPGIEFRLGVKITGLNRAANDFHLSGPEDAAQQVVLAVHPARLPALVAKLPQMSVISDQVADFSWLPILTLWLHFAAPLRFPFPLLALGEGVAPWAFERHDIAKGVIAIVMSADGPHLQLPAARLRDAYLDLLAKALGPLPALLDWKIITEKRATWACTPNQPRPGNATPLPGLFLAGDYTSPEDRSETYPATLEGAVRSGVKCARLLLAHGK